MGKISIHSLLLLTLALALGSCRTMDQDHLVRVSVADQKMLVFHHGVEVARYDVSTSKFGVGDRLGSFATPLGAMEVAKKIGDNAPSGMRFKNRRATGEIVRPDAPGRDPIVSRILWLRGREPQNRLAYERAIYIHGTAEEAKIGTPASYGCIRMRSRDVIQLYRMLGVGATVEVTAAHFPAPLVKAAPPPKPLPTVTPSPTSPAQNTAPTPGTPPALPGSAPAPGSPPAATTASGPQPRRG